jgi:sugar lactone lactonase YvrE
MAIVERRAELILDGLYLPEGARWHDGRLWFGEIQAARVSALDDSGRREIVAGFDSPCSGLGFLPDGNLVASLMQERRLARVAPGSGEIGVHADLGDLPFDHINDIVTDAASRTFVDALAYHMHFEAPEKLEDGTVFHGFENHAGHTPDAVTDSIVCVAPDGSARVVAGGVLGPNGLAIIDEGRTLVAAEWRADRLTSFAIDDDGGLGKPRLFGLAPALPDGLYPDSEDGVWVASPVSGDCVRMIAGGEITERVVPTVGNRVTACALGGPDRRTLYLTTDRHPMRGGGAIEAVEVDVPGLEDRQGR